MRGVVWIIGRQLFAFPFVEGSQVGVAKSGLTYNHKLLWPHVRPKGCNRPYNYYPRGRVDYNGKGKPVLYMNRNVSLEYVPDIIKAFELEDEPIIRIDRSRHYRCYLDTE